MNSIYIPENVNNLKIRLLIQKVLTLYILYIYTETRSATKVALNLIYLDRK